MIGAAHGVAMDKRVSLVVKADESIAKVSIDNLTQISTTEFEFELHVKRLSPSWERWANGTFQIKIVGLPADHYDSTKLSFSMVPGSSQLPDQRYVKDVLTRYVITPEIVSNSHLAVTVLGPDEYADAKFIARDDSLRIGRFRIYSIDSTRLRDTVYWVSPVEYFQAESFKVEVDSLNGALKLYNSNDNVEMNDLSCFSGSTLRRKDTFVVAARPTKCMKIDSLQAVYLGDRYVKIKWNTTCEQAVEGYILRRRVRQSLCLDPSDLEFREIRRFGKPFDPEMFSKGRTTTGFSYDLTIPDTVKYRDVEYEYELSGLYFDGTREFIDTASIYIPNGIIIKSAVFPNPVVDSATIFYMVDDAVRITARVYDMAGKEIQTLMEDKLHSRRLSMKDWKEVRAEDTYSVGWTRPEQGGQGVYIIVFIAYPVESKSIELSRSVLKVMVLR
jgi:hypothetical protein